ncbi:hypothetical protein SELMODRAFT_406835 [Selaginella moellendorffii]|uniref:Uncharacterized protein n=1 Tax=Selaginella moellendorffii TaxID=88036 RepID=D8R336_SELML|nr:hypothetical protein SELMODRAFT_406835 [Selaginella moellendorffii]
MASWTRCKTSKQLPSTGSFYSKPDITVEPISDVSGLAMDLQDGLRNITAVSAQSVVGWPDICVEWRDRDDAPALLVGMKDAMKAMVKDLATTLDGSSTEDQIHEELKFWSSGEFELGSRLYKFNCDILMLRCATATKWCSRSGTLGAIGAA